MGCFSNGTEGRDYQARYCSHCVHDKDGNCPVWLLHLLHNRDGASNPDSFLHVLIPRDGLRNGQCTMFVKADELTSVLNDLVSSVLKMDDAPMSADAHMDRAIAALAKLCPGWKPSCDEAADVVNGAKEHVDSYRTEPEEEETPECEHRWIFRGTARDGTDFYRCSRCKMETE